MNVGQVELPSWSPDKPDSLIEAMADSLREMLGHTTLDMARHHLHFTSLQITAQHHIYSPIHRLEGDGRQWRQYMTTDTSNLNQGVD